MTFPKKGLARKPYLKSPFNGQLTVESTLNQPFTSALVFNREDYGAALVPRVIDRRV